MKNGNLPELLLDLERPMDMGMMLLLSCVLIPEGEDPVTYNLRLDVSSYDRENSSWKLGI